MHSNWRDCQAWRQEGLAMTTTSNEAAKLYDAALTQHVGMYEDATMGGLESTLEQMIVADENFVMGRVLKLGLTGFSTTRTDTKLQYDVTYLTELAGRSEITDREKRHIRAIEFLLNGQLIAATDAWQDILVDYPTDMCAIRLSDSIYFLTGQKAGIRDNIAKVLPRWSATMPLYGTVRFFPELYITTEYTYSIMLVSYLHGMLAFGLEETQHYTAAEQHARTALSINPYNAWATHALAHVMEMDGRTHEGIRYLKSNVNDWDTCAGISYHIYWHWALYHIEEGQLEEALTLCETEVMRRAKGIPDMASLLMRFGMEGIDVEKNWLSLYDICKDSPASHGLLYNDLHLLIVYLGAHKIEAADELMEYIRENMKHDGDQEQAWRDVGYRACQALKAFHSHNYDDAINLLSPIRYEITKVGGSDAQRDLYNLMLIQSALRSRDQHYHQMAINLLNERKTVRPVSPMTDRLILKALALVNNE